MKVIEKGMVEFDAVQEVELLSNCYVNGKFCTKGTKVKVKGNDKIQLLASKRGKLVEPVAPDDKKGK